MNRKTVIAAIGAGVDAATAAGDFHASASLTDLMRRIVLSKEGNDRRNVISCIVRYANESDERGDADFADNLTAVASHLAELDFDAEPEAEIDITSEAALERVMEGLTHMRDEVMDHLAVHHNSLSDEDRSKLHAFLAATEAHEADMDEHLEQRLR